MPVELKAFYERTYSSGEAEGRRYAQWRALSALAKADHVIELIPERLAEQPVRILDIGCGDGALLAELGRRSPSWRLHGVEIAERAVELAGSRCPQAEIRSYDGETLPYGEREFDLAVLSHVLEHVPDPAAVLREAGRVAGRVIVEVPLEDNLSARRAAKRGIAQEVGHIQRFSQASVRQVAGAAGLRVSASLSDPLGRDVHTFFAQSPGARARGSAKWLLRRSIHAVSPPAAQRLFTVHYACRCEPAPAPRSASP
jgi:SAM-dependent methyltransferase